ncbi:putative F-box/FBD/LRR-repeat protein At4g03220 [Nicotiana tomentosiformis]|uniref:putative F-box/FBD/LRR-repeat protein At4g03220 n=1 Tax=Nicotiana tomentosiformis TaxID=4098 RepID=UPI00051C35EF|nr:putative F-box/FBD/LRR-repeat protein At4g03220 [Nicotiana tomentosiformis]
METRSAKKIRLLNEIYESFSSCGEDRISDLPDAVLHHILFSLPIKSIAKTSVLSKRWRYLWYTFPDLDFTTINVPSSINSTPKVSPNSHKKLHTTWSNIAGGADFIDQVLSLREKNSGIRFLRFRANLSFSRLNSLIRGAVKHNVQELDVEVATNDYFNFPRSAISSDSLRVFKLKSKYPGFRLPPSSIMKNGFRNLFSLSLSCIIMYEQPSLHDLFTDSSFPLLKKLNLENCSGLIYLHVSCRVLEELTLENCFQLEHLDVTGPKLESLSVKSCFDSYTSGTKVKVNGPRLKRIIWSSNTITDQSCLENLTSLIEALVGFFVLLEDLSAMKLRSVNDFLSGLSHSHSLLLENQSVEILSKNNHLAGISLRPFTKLRCLELHTGFRKHNIPGLANIFRSSPATNTLILKITNDHNIERRKWNRDLWQLSNSGEERFWESQSHAINSFLQHLKVVKIYGFSECESDVSLVKFLLKHGKVLQEMFLCAEISKSRDSLHREKIKSQIMGFSKASCNAKIVFK